MEIAIEQPKQSSFGEIAVPAAFQLAKELKQAPKKIAAELVARLGAVPGVASMEIAGNGYINMRFDRGALRRGAAEAGDGDGEVGRRGRSSSSTPTSIPTKRRNRAPAQRGPGRYVRADAARAAATRWRFRTTSTTPACRLRMLWPGFTFWKGDAGGCGGADCAEAGAFDYFCWDLYARTSQHYKDHPEDMKWRAETLHAIEAGQGALAEMAHLVADAIVNAHLATMLRLNIQYDVLPRESEILHLQFWAAAFELLKERKAIYFEEEGKNAGCWVMPSSSFRGEGRRERRQQGDCAVERHRDLCRQGHRVPAVEVRAAGQGFLLSAADALYRRA